MVFTSLTHGKDYESVYRHPANTKDSITFVQCWANPKDFVPPLCKCYSLEMLCVCWTSGNRQSEVCEERQKALGGGVAILFKMEISYPNKHEMLVYCWANIVVGGATVIPTLGQRLMFAGMILT